MIINHTTKIIIFSRFVLQLHLSNIMKVLCKIFKYSLAKSIIKFIELHTSCQMLIIWSKYWLIFKHSYIHQSLLNLYAWTQTVPRGIQTVWELDSRNPRSWWRHQNQHGSSWWYLQYLHGSSWLSYPRMVLPCPELETYRQYMYKIYYYTIYLFAPYLFTQIPIKKKFLTFPKII